MRRFVWLWFLGLAAAVPASVRLAPASAPTGFESAQQLRRFATDNGFHTASLNVEPSMGFCVSDHPISTRELLSMEPYRLRESVRGWRGTIWATQLSTGDIHILPESIPGYWRVWGNVIVTGDEEILDRLARLRGIP